VVTAVRGPAGDVERQVVVALSAVAALVAAFIGSGAVVGTPIAQAAGGALSASATLVAPAGPAFSIWSVIYLMLLGLAGWQALPAQRENPRLRGLGYPIAVTMLLNGVWILCVQVGWLAVTLPVIVALLVALAYVFAQLLRAPPGSGTEAVLLHGTIGLYLGWVMVATIANTAALLVDRGVPATGTGPTVAAVVVLLVAAVLGAGLARTGPVAPVLSFVWGLAWIAVGRTDDPASTPTVVTAAAAAAVTVALALGTLVMRNGRAGAAGT
jgi:hypothetical protein